MQDKQSLKFFFFVGEERYETDQDNVTGAYVKSRISDLPAGSGLQLDGDGNDPDITFADDAVESLEIGHGRGPRRFTVVPPASFGQ